jgi:hypothetical protein
MKFTISYKDGDKVCSTSPHKTLKSTLSVLSAIIDSFIKEGCTEFNICVEAKINGKEI